MPGERATTVTRRAAALVVAVLVVVGVGWALWSRGSDVPSQIAEDAAPGTQWELVAQPAERSGVARLPLLGRIVDPGRGEWVWHVTGPPDELAVDVAAWLLQQPPPGESGEDGWSRQVPPTRGREGRTWDGQLTAGGASTLRGESATVFGSVTVTVTVQPVPIADELAQVTVRVE